MRQLVTSAKAILLCAVLQGAALAPAQDPAVARLFPARPTGYVTDVAGALDAGSTQRITALAERLRGATGAELAVVVLPTIGDRAPVEVATAIGRAWGVGANAAVGDQRRNAGLVILLVPRQAGDPNSGQIFLATGNGLEGIVTDLQAGRARDLMRRYFQRGEYAAGLEAGVRSLAGLIARGMGVSDTALTTLTPPRSRNEAPSRSRSALVQFVVVLGFIILLIAMTGGGRRGRRGKRGRRGPGPWIFWGGGGGGHGGGGFGGFGGFGGGGGGGFGGFGGGGGFSGGGAGGRF